MQGLNGYMQGRDKRRAQDMQDAEITRDEQRRQEDLAIRREMQAAQVEQMRAAREERERQAAREMQMDRRTAADRGEAPVEQVRAAGTNMAGAFGGGNALADVGTKAMGGMLAQQAKTPTYEIGGTGYVKAGPSLAERSAEMQAKQRSAEQNAAQIARREEREADQRFTMGENEKNRRATMAQINARMSDPAASQPQPAKTLPMGEVDKLSSQANAVAQLDELERELSQPQAKGSMGLYPNLAGQRIANIVDKKGAGVRASIANISSLTYLDRSGAAVTPSEDARLAPLVPRADDPQDVALVKLKKLRAHIERERATVSDYYQQQGYALPQGRPAPDVRQDRPPLDSFMVRR